MSRKIVFCILSVALAVGFLAVHGAAQENSSPLSPKEEDDFRKYLAEIKKPDGERAQWVARRAGPRLLPLAMQILEEDVPKEVECELHIIVSFLGRGNDEVVAKLIEHVEKPLPHILTPNEARALDAALVGIGQAGTDEGLDFVQKAMTEEYWLNRKDRPAIPEWASGVDGTRTHLRQMAFNSFCASKTRRALEALEKWEGLPEDFRRQREIELKHFGKVIDDIPAKGSEIKKP